MGWAVVLGFLFILLIFELYFEWRDNKRESQE